MLMLQSPNRIIQNLSLPAAQTEYSARVLPVSIQGLTSFQALRITDSAQSDESNSELLALRQVACSQAEFGLRVAILASLKDHGKPLQ